MSSRDYRTLANSPAGAISDTDTFTYDSASRMLTAESGRYTNTERLRWGQVRFSVLDLVIIVCDWLKTENLA